MQSVLRALLAGLSLQMTYGCFNLCCNLVQRFQIALQKVCDVIRMFMGGRIGSGCRLWHSHGIYFSWLCSQENITIGNQLLPVAGNAEFSRQESFCCWKWIWSPKFSTISPPFLDSWMKCKYSEELWGTSERRLSIGCSLQFN